MSTTTEDLRTEDFLEHYGVKGMKWGVRGSKSETGVSRTRGALIDRADRKKANYQELKDGLSSKPTSKRVAAINMTNRMTMGKKLTEKYYDTQINEATKRGDRLKDGKTTVSDILSSLTVTSAEAFVSVRPRD